MASAEESKTEVGPSAIFYTHPFAEELIATARKMATPGKGLLAADESTGTIGARFSAISVENNEENRRRYRELLFTSKGLGDHISGVILYDETIRQKSKSGTPFVKILSDAGVIPGIKVDLGTRDLVGKPGEVYTQGLTDLDIRAKEYYALGARFAKWRAVLKIQDGSISETSIKETAWTLARYAAICQAHGLVPIVEPEILMDGSHSLRVNQYWTEKTLSACYKALVDQEVLLEGSVLKPNMCMPGKGCSDKRSIKGHAAATVRALLRTVPAAVPGIFFLSGGMSEEEATEMLNAINDGTTLPWSASFSFGRALQKSTLEAWKGDDANIAAAQEVLLLRAKANGAANLGKYDGFAATAESKKSLYEKGYVY
jgi:fructose-bisphosphate aldolase class I